MAFCSKCGTSLPDGADFCASCGTKNAPAQEKDCPAKRTGKLHCPNCKSYNFSTVTESSVNGAVSTGRNIRTTSVSNTHRNFWICSDCGTKFRNIQNLEEEIRKSKSSPVVMTIITVICTALTAFLLVQKLNSPFGGFMLLPYLVGAAFVTIMSFIYIFISKSKLKKMKNELVYLKENCFD